MATREEIFVLLRSNDHRTVRDGLYKAKLYDSELYGYCIKLFELCGYSIKDFIWAMDYQKGIGGRMSKEMIQVVEDADLNEIGDFLGIDLELWSITLSGFSKPAAHELRINYYKGKPATKK